MYTGEYITQPVDVLLFLIINPGHIESCPILNKGGQNSDIVHHCEEVIPSSL